MKKPNKIKLVLIYFTLSLLLNSCKNESNNNSIVETSDKTTSQITFNDFKNSVIGKSMEEVKKIYGIPCKAQELMGIKAWYYGPSSCKDNTNRIKIINEDSQNEIEMVQIQFIDNSATAVNSY